VNRDLYLVAVNLTRRCNLACAHCYLDAETLAHGGPDELDTNEVQNLLSEIASRSTDTMVVLTGGEPLLRRDLEPLLKHGSDLGLAMVVGTNGVLLTEQRAKSLKAAGAMGAGISLDSLDPARHDAFRGCTGSWEKTLAGMDNCRRHDLPFQVHFSVTEQNAAEVPGMIDFARAVGAKVLNIFFLVCTGRGEGMSDITPQRYEEVLRQLVEAQNSSNDLLIRARCAPHYKRIAYQIDPESTLTRAQGYEGGGCLAGIHYCRITPEGGVTACPYIPDEEGSIRGESFWNIWDNSPTFAQLSAPQLEGKCGRCEYQQLCGGCRARPLALGQGLMAEDPWCGYQPQNGEVIQPLKEQDEATVTWSPEAEQRLTRVPGFLHKMVKKRAESYVRDLGESMVTVEHMQTLAKRRFGDQMPGRPGTAQQSDSSSASATRIAWTAEARDYLDGLPPFLQGGIQAVAEDVARTEGRLEVNMKLLNRLEEEDDPQRKLPWEPEAEARLLQWLEPKRPQVRLFVQPTLEAAAEREAKRRSAIVVSLADVDNIIATQLAGVEWDADALARVESAPDFNRAGIKKAAEFNARREGLARITSEDLTRFRNRAMMRAVRRMKGFGMTDLSFDAWEIAKERVPRLRDNEQAERRFEAIRSYVETHQKPDGSGLGQLGKAFVDKMRDELRDNRKKR